MGIRLAVVLTFTAMVGHASAQVSANAVEEQLSGATPAARATDAGQINPVAGRTDLLASQIVPEQRGKAIDTGQLTSDARTAEAAPSVSSPAQGRNTRLGSVAGHDRCDVSAGATADRSGCDQIPDNRADAFGSSHLQTAPRVVDPDTTAPDLVDNIINGGTGTVVSIPK